MRRARPLAALLAFGAALAGCPGAGPHPRAPDPAWTGLFDPLLDGFIEGQTAECRSLGLHDRCDGVIADYSKAGIERRIAFLRDVERKLAAVDEGALDADAFLDARLLDLAVKQELFRLVDLELWRRRPDFYSELFSVEGYLLRDYAPLDQRVRALVKHANAALPQTEHVLANLHPTVPQSFLVTDIGIFEGYRDYLRKDVVDVLAKVSDTALREEAIRAVRALADRADGVVAGLRDRMSASDDSHVLGIERYTKLLLVQEALDVDLADFSVLAENDLHRNKRAYEELTKAGVRQTRPAVGELLGRARKITDDARAFVLEKKLVTLPKEGKFVVEETPIFMRWNSAFLNGPGPFDEPGLTAFYYITPPDPSWEAWQQRDYLMPEGTLLATSVHEVYPGHYLQGLWARNAPTRAQRMLGSYSFVEGWAHYTEQLMIEEGFGADDPQNELGQLSDALLRNCRFVVSIGVHTRDMSLAEAERRFRDDCFQDGATARQEAYRSTFDPGYFAYTLGKLQILELRKEVKSKLGARFDLRRFHDALLSHGSPPVSTIRQRVLEEIAR